MNSIQDEENPRSDRGFDAVKEEIDVLNKLQEQSKDIMENLESICSENGRICENMMAALESPSVRNEQHLERIRQMDAAVRNADVCSIAVFDLACKICVVQEWLEALTNCTFEIYFLFHLQIGTDQSKIAQDAFFGAANDDVDLAAPMESEIGSSKVALGLKLRGGCSSKDIGLLRTGDIAYSGMSFSLRPRR